MPGTTDRRNYWGVVAPTLPARQIAELARQQEAAGLQGTFAAQVYGPPFIPLAAAAVATERLLLASGIAIAFTRSPFETAMAAIDLDRLSGGRFILGLGSSVGSWVEGFFGMPYGKPAEHLREVVDLVRLVIARSHTGTLTRYDGKYHRHDFHELQPTAPPLRTDIPIWLAAMRASLVTLAGEIADGIMGHPMWSIPWATTRMPEALKQGLDRGGRARTAMHVNCWFWVTPNADIRQSVEDGRACVAFYAGIAQYEEYFAAHGFRAECKRLQEGVQNGDYRGVAHLVPDAMVETFVLTGRPDEVRRKLEPVWAFADSVTLIPPFLSLTPEQSGAYFETIAETFYTG
jgi:probable F420-dependent oxidoreductase